MSSKNKKVMEMSKENEEVINEDIRKIEKNKPKPTHPIVQRILDVLEERGKTKTELASVLNASPSLITKWKNAGYMPPVESIVDICKFLNVSIEYILTGNGSSASLDKIQSPELEKDERELVAYYRRMSIPQRGKFLGQIKATVHKEQLLY